MIAAGISAVMCLPAGAYYAGTLSRGAKGAELWKVGPTYLPYVVYEFTGLSGLGPATPEIREAVKGGTLKDFVSEHRFEITCVIVGTLGGLFLTLAMVWAIREQGADQQLMATCGVLAIVFSAFTAASFAAEKAFWARHYAPVFPFYIAALGLGIKAGLGSSYRSIVRPAIMSYVGVALFSSLSIRFAPRHRKEDYRSASAVAREALNQGKSVWWIAGPEAAEYCGVPLTHTGFQEGRAYSPSSKIRLKTPPPDLAQLPRPDLIVMSRPDAFDPNRSAQAIVKDEGYHRTGGARFFEFYRR